MRPTLETPDTSEVFRGLPLTENQNANDIFHKGPFKSFSVSGNYCVTGSQNVRIWYAPTAENKSTIALNIEVTATSFVSASDISYDGVLVWVAVDKGEMLEIDTKENTVMHKSVVHNSTVNAIIKSRNAMFTFDDTSFRIWRYDNHGRIRLSSRSKSILLPSKKSLFLIVNETQLWASHEKLLEVYDIFEDSISSIGKFDCKIKEHSNSPTLGMITTIAQLASRKRVFTGHEDGKIIVFNSETLTKIHIIQASTYKITTLLGVGEYLWAGLATGKILIFELTNSEQLVLKVEFLAYAGSGVKDLQLDDNSLAIRSTLQVFSSNDSGHIRIWDGLLTQYKREIAMNYRVDEYSIYTPIRILILTYNIDSRKPIDLEVGDQADKTFLQDLVANNDADIYIFGFQELIDLENKSVNAKTFLIGGKKSALDSKMDQRLKLWQERLLRLFPSSHNVVHVSQLVGLFQCIITNNSFAIRDCSTSQVKTGLKGLHGNKGAIATRFLIGDSSFCFVNCHLAAHQKQVSQRNNDIAQILKDASFPKLENAGWERGGDGTMILDHENVFWNGDLNYRIDLTRHEAMDCIHSRDYQKLWQYDQLNNQMLVHSFGLRMFKEGELLFDPTFKYDRNTQRYDSSEKMRIPAYCDRILWRGNRVELLAYNRLECKISDHRPVYGSFIAKVRKIDATRYQKVKKDVKEKTEWRLEEQSRQSRLEWLKATYNLSIEEAKQKLQEHNWDLRAVFSPS
ncbi:Endonuclease/exonuclease/phosphatase [Globomyces pollinis-pini]|nr:Endonuclease/exonuclease/phosphatase [Globomyces pollinis-pini]